MMAQSCRGQPGAQTRRPDDRGLCPQDHPRMGNACGRAPEGGLHRDRGLALDTEMKSRLRGMESAALASSIFLVARKREGTLTGSYEDEVRSELDKIVRERVDSLWKMGITGSDLVIAAVGAGLRAFTKFARVEYANGEEVPAEKFLAEVEGVVLETLLEKIFGVTGSGVAAVDGPSRFTCSGATPTRRRDGRRRGHRLYL